MTISTTTIKNSFSGDSSTTEFTYTFKITSENDIEVIIRSSDDVETTKTKDTHFTVSGVGNSGGGSVTFTAGNIPVTGETVVIRRSTTQTQSMDLIDNDPLGAETLENTFDKITAIAQELQEQADRSIKLSPTNTIGNTTFNMSPTNRAGAVLGFDGSGELEVTRSFGSNKGDWVSGTTYANRDIIKDTGNGNIYMVNTGHDASGSLPISSNTNTAYYDLLVDNAASQTAQTSATSAASTATTKAAEALASKNSAETAETNALASKNSAETAETNAETAETNAESSETNALASKNAAASSEANAAASATQAAASAGGGASIGFAIAMSIAM